MADSSKPRRPKRVFDEEFKAQAVRLVLEDGKSASAVARDLDLTPSMFRIWVARARADRTHGRGYDLIRPESSTGTERH